MSSCISYTVINDPNLKTLSPAARCRLFALAGLFDEFGDGQFEDNDLRRFLGIRRVDFDSFIAKTILLKHLRRDANDRICRAGPLNPNTINKREARHESDRRADDPAVLDLTAKLTGLQTNVLELTDLVHNLYSIVRTKGGQKEDKTGTNGTQSDEQLASHASQNGTAPHTHASAEDSILESNRIESNREHSSPNRIESNRIESNGGPKSKPSLAVVTEPQEFDVKVLLMKHGFTPTQCSNVLSGGMSLRKIMDGIQCYDDGGWPNSKSSVKTLHTYISGDLPLSPKWLKNRVVPTRPAADAAVKSGQVSVPMVVNCSVNGREKEEEEEELDTDDPTQEELEAMRQEMGVAN